MTRSTVGSPVRAAVMRLPASAARRPASTWTRSGSSGIAGGWSLAFPVARVQTGVMPLPMLVVVVLVSAGCVVFLVRQVRDLRRRKRNLEHWEKGEPLEGVGDWDLGPPRSASACGPPAGAGGACRAAAGIQLLRGRRPVARVPANAGLAGRGAGRERVEEAQRVGEVQPPVGPVVAARELLVLVLDAARVQRCVQRAVARAAGDRRCRSRSAAAAAGRRSISSQCSAVPSGCPNPGSASSRSSIDLVQAAERRHRRVRRDAAKTIGVLGAQAQRAEAAHRQAGDEQRRIRRDAIVGQRRGGRHLVDDPAFVVGVGVRHVAAAVAPQPVRRHRQRDRRRSPRRRPGARPSGARRRAAATTRRCRPRRAAGSRAAAAPPPRRSAAPRRRHPRGARSPGC